MIVSALAFIVVFAWLWLMAGTDLLWENSTADCLVASANLVVRERSTACWELPDVLGKKKDCGDKSWCGQAKIAFTGSSRWGPIPCFATVVIVLFSSICRRNLAICAVWNRNRRDSTTLWRGSRLRGATPRAARAVAWVLVSKMNAQSYEKM